LIGRLLQESSAHGTHTRYDKALFNPKETEQWQSR